VTTAEDTAMAITLTGTDPDGNPLTFSIVTPPAHGTLSGTAPNVTYTPAANYNGTDSFTFKVNDGTTDSTVATVSLNITAVNDAPVATNSALTVGAGQSVGGTLVASDVDGNSLTYRITMQPAKGTLTSFNASTGAFVYTAKTNGKGTDTFKFTASDGSLTSNTATVSVTVK
jgi:VCBS repeat-containing protein